MITAINYANEPYREAQIYCTKKAYSVGKVDRVIEYGPTDIDNGFYERNKKILENKRGAGLWLWKPYIICKTLDAIEDGEYLLYCDSGSYFINRASYLIEAMDYMNQDILCFDLGNLLEKSYTMPSLFEEMGCDAVEYRETPQRLATFILCRKTEFTSRFFQEYLQYAQNENAIWDKNPELSKDKVPGFVAHREDQSIYSLLTKKYKLKAACNPSQWGGQRGIMNVLKDYRRRKNSDNVLDYPVIFISHRAKKVNFKVKMKVYLMMLFPKTVDMFRNK